jgi:hypothetical protein
MSIHLSIYEQLWYVALLADSKLLIFIYGEYETVFFVPYRSKFGVKYAYMPNFIQKLTFVGKEIGFDLILLELKKRLKFGEISIKIEEKRFDLIKPRTNFTLDLENSYVELKKNFSDNHKRNISKVKHIEIRQSENIDDLISIFKAEKVNSFRSNQLNQIENDLNRILTCNKLNDRIFIFNAYESNHIIASALFIHFNNVIYYVIGSSLKSDTRVSSSGLFKIFDYVINRFSGTKTILDFEGSDIPGIKRFFKGFGSKEEKYYFVKWNRLPFPFNKLKK